MSDHPELQPAPADLTGRLSQVRWIGGGSGAGKSSIARRLADRHGLRVYSCDEAIARHVPRLSPADAPLLHAFLGMNMDQRWVERTPDEMSRTFPWFAGEGFILIVEDLLALPSEAVLVEGFRALPRLVAPLLSGPMQAVWLAPTPPFRRAALEQRGTLWEIPNKTSDPARALANLLARDALFTDELTREASVLGLPVLPVDGTRSEDTMAALVARHLGLAALTSHSAPPCAGRASQSDSR